MPFSIEQYKRKLQVRAAQTASKRSTRATPSAAAATANADFVFEGLQKTYLDFCVAKTLNPDHKLLGSLKARSFVLQLDALSDEELSLHMDFLQKTTALLQISLSLSSVAVNRGPSGSPLHVNFTICSELVNVLLDVRKKFERLGLSKSPAFKKESAAMILRSVCAACVRSPNLTRLQLRGIFIAESQAALLSRAIAKCDMLEIVHLGGARIGDKGVEALSLTLGKRPRLFYVNLSECKLTSDAKDHIAKIMTLHGTLRDEAAWSASLRGTSTSSESKRPKLLIDLSHNSLGDASAEAICAALYHDKWVLGLNLSENQLTVGGLRQFSETVLQSNSTLTVLRLSSKESSPEVESIVRNLDSLVTKRIRNLREMSAESNERRLLLCNLLLGWSVQQDVVLQLCSDPHEPKATDTTSIELPNNQESHHILDGEKKMTPSNRSTGGAESNHIQTIKFLVDRLSAIEAEQKKTAQLVERLEEENHELRATIKAMREGSREVTQPALEESVIAQLETSITLLALQVEELERERR